MTATEPRVGSMEAVQAQKAASQQRFLDAYAQACSVLGACRLSGVGRRTHYQWLETDESYVALFKDAKEDAADLLQSEGVRRARQGVDEPVYQGGKRVGTVRKYSDTLLIFLLKGLRPELFKERHEHTGRDGGPIENAVTLYRFALPENGRNAG